MRISTYNENGPGREKVFVEILDGNIKSVVLGNKAVSKHSGIQFYIDSHVADQIDKCELYFDGLNPKLRLIEGEILDIPRKTEKELEIERLRYELEILQNAE